MNTPLVFGGERNTSSCLSQVLSNFRARLSTATADTMTDLITDVRSEMRACNRGTRSSSSTTGRATSTSTQNDDPGSGLWMPEGYPNLYVADSSGVWTGPEILLPGCLNGEESKTKNSGCAAKYSFEDKLVNRNQTVSFYFSPKRTLSLRLGKTIRREQLKYTRDFDFLSVKNRFGTQPGTGAKIWISTDPRIPFDEIDSNCKTESGVSLYFSFIQKERRGRKICILKENTQYYFNIIYANSGELLSLDINRSEIFGGYSAAARPRSVIERLTKKLAGDRYSVFIKWADDGITPIFRPPSINTSSTTSQGEVYTKQQLPCTKPDGAVIQHNETTSVHYRTASGDCSLVAVKCVNGVLDHTKTSQFSPFIPPPSDYLSPSKACHY